MAKVYINDVLQTSPIKMLKTDNEINICPTDNSTSLNLGAVGKGRGIVYNDVFVLMDNQNQAQAMSTGFNSTENKAVVNYLHIFYGFNNTSTTVFKKWARRTLYVSGDSVFTTSSSGTIRIADMILYNNNVYIIFYKNISGGFHLYLCKIDNPSTLCSSAYANYYATCVAKLENLSYVSNVSYVSDPYVCGIRGVVYDNKIHIISGTGGHFVFEDTNNTLTDITPNNSTSFTSVFNAFFPVVLNNKLTVITRGKYHIFNDSDYSWNEQTVTMIGIGDTEAEFRTLSFVVDNNNSVHQIGSIEGYDGTTAWDYIYDENTTTPNYLPVSTNIYTAFLYKNYIIIAGVYSSSSNYSTYRNKAYAISEDVRNSVASGWKEYINEPTYQIVSSTVNLPNNDTITFDASGNVVNN